MRYVDTSVLISYMTPETGSAAAEGLMLSAGEPLAVSTWTEVELLSALGLKIRTNQLTLTEAQLVLDAYRRLVSPNLQRLPVEDADHQRAADFLGGWTTPLRAADALHLAVADAHGATVVTFDHVMGRAATALGLPVKLLS